MADLKEILKHRILLLDGAMGTEIQAYKLEEEDFMTAIMLPVQRFRKSSASKVWSDSRKVI